MNILLKVRLSYYYANIGSMVGKLMLQECVDAFGLVISVTSRTNKGGWNTGSAEAMTGGADEGNADLTVYCTCQHQKG